MAAPKKNLFKKSDDPKPQKEVESIEGLKSQLQTLQSKIEEIEGPNTGQEEKVTSYQEVATLFKWASASHIFIPRGKKWLTYVILITGLIALIVLFLREFFVLAPLLAVAFFVYILSSIPPENIEHKITSQGLISGKKDYLWEELYDFTFTEKHGHTILNVDLQSGYPNKLILLIDAKDKEKIKNSMLNFLPYREIPITNWLDSAGERLSNLFHKVAT